MDIASSQSEAPNLTNVNIMPRESGLSVVDRVAIELAIFDCDIAVRIASREYSHLIVVKRGVPYHEVRPLQANASSILVTHLGPREFHILDCGVVAFDDPYRFVLGALTSRSEMRPPTNTL